MANVILPGDCRETIKTLPEKSIQCVVTSPPYWGLRSYLEDGSPLKDHELGSEETPDEYVEHMVGVFREVRRVLRDDGVVWLNLGDSYCPDHAQRRLTMPEGQANYGLQAKTVGSRARDKRGPSPGLKPKDLVGIPWMVAFALRADGWYLRQDVIWSKGNCMPEPVTDRCTRSHEYLFMLALKPWYFYDQDAIREAAATDHLPGQKIRETHHYSPDNGGNAGLTEVLQKYHQEGLPTSRNKRSVWNVNPRPYEGAHFAVMPPALVEPCILAGTSAAGCCPTCGAPWERVTQPIQGDPDPTQRSTAHYDTRDRYGAGNSGNSGLDKLAAKMREGTHHRATVGWVPSCKCPEHTPVPCKVLDPFGGSGTVGMVANWHNRDSIICELNPEYIPLIEDRVKMERTDTGGWKPSVSSEASLDLLDIFG